METTTDTACTRHTRNGPEAGPGGSDIHGAGGFAMPAAILALVTLGVLVVGGFFMAQQESRIGIANERSSLAFYLAEVGMADVVENWSGIQMASMTIRSDTSSFSASTAEGEWEVDVTRVGERLYFLDATGRITRGTGVWGDAVRDLGLLGRTRSIDLNPQAAVTTYGGVGFKGAPPRIIGLDSDPAAWSAAMCPSSLQDATGFLTDDASSISGSGGPSGKGGGGKGKGGGGGGGSCVHWIDGAPCVEEDEAKVDETWAPFQGPAWNEVTALADHTLTSGLNPAPSLTSSGACNIGDPGNWGDPNNPGAPCANYYPIIHIDGDARLSGNGQGQGILLVDGDLMITGTFDFYGVIVIRGDFEARGTPGVMGAIISEGVDNLRGTPDMVYSSCAIERAILGSSASRLDPIFERGWIDLTGVTGN